MTTEKQSEFGRGLVLCLVKCAEHWGKLGADIDAYRKASLGENSAARNNIYGAGDHLFDMEVPAAMQGTALGRSIMSLQSLGIRLRDPLNDDVTLSDVTAFYAELRRVAMEIDRYLGLEPDEGAW